MSSDDDLSVPTVEFDAGSYNETTPSTSLDEGASNADNELTVPIPRSRANSEVQFDVEMMLPSQLPGKSTPLIKDVVHNRDIFYSKEDAWPVDEYPKTQRDPGTVVIFNFENFANQRPRDGTRIDVASFIDAISRTGYNIDSQKIYNNLTKTELESAINSIKAGVDTFNCLIVLFLTHGNEHNKLETFDKSVTVEEVIEEFQCEKLRNVPQWYTFLACKVEHENKPPSKKIVSDTTFTKRLPDDVIIYYSTIEGNKSARTYEEGTWVIQELCKNLLSNGRREDLFNVLTRTNKCVANNYYSLQEDKSIFQQTPVIVSTLTRKFYLTMDRNRRAQLYNYRKIKEILAKIKK